LDRLPIHAVIPAAGRGDRFGDGLPKQFIVVAGQPVLAWSIRRLLASGVAEVVVALAEEHLEEAPTRVLDDSRVRWVRGGPSRQESVIAGLEAVPDAAEALVVVHDGARPAVAVADIEATIEAAQREGGAVLGRPVSDTLKRIEEGAVVRTVDRRGLFRAETPQVFRRGILERAVELSRREGFQGTDEATLVERLPGARIVAVNAVHPNPKLTEPGDLPLIESLLQSAED
jgi:2-C-methyl-D-erythritol 4-phosphate cytidylyltransferase